MLQVIDWRTWKETCWTNLTDLIPSETAGECACRRGWQFLCTPSVCIHTKCCCFLHRYIFISNIYWTGAVQWCKDVGRAMWCKNYMTVVCHILIEITVNKVRCPFNAVWSFLSKFSPQSSLLARLLWLQNLATVGSCNVVCITLVF